MRDIKFRMWNSCGKSSRFLYSFQALECMNQQQLGIYDHEKDGCAFEQFTGLKDKNGKEIYEGDIVLTSLFFEGHRLPHQGIVVYSSEYGSFGTQNESGITLVHNHAINDREVIGNIHENPELLK